MAKSRNQGKVKCKSCNKMVSSRGDVCPRDGCNGKIYIKKDKTEVDRTNRPASDAPKDKKAFSVTDKQIEIVTELVIQVQQNGGITADAIVKQRDVSPDDLLKPGMSEKEVVEAYQKYHRDSELGKLKGVGKPMIAKIIRKIKQNVG